MSKKKYPHFWPQFIPQIALLTSASIIAAFVLGIYAAGTIHPFTPSEAASQKVLSASAAIQGDINGDGVLDLQDAIEILESAMGYRIATSDEIRRGDMNGDGKLTLEDARLVLKKIIATDGLQ
jgi:hypothetical protein